MLKRVCSGLITATVVIIFSMQAFAGPLDFMYGFTTKASAEETTSNTSVYEQKNDKAEVIDIEDIVVNKTQSTGQFLVTITRPDGDETAFKKSYVICGMTDQSDIGIILATKNEQTGVYEELKNTEGQSRWDVGSFGLFTKEVMLKKGANKIKIIAYKKSEIDNLKYEESLQVNYFTVTVLEETVKDKIMNKVLNITEIFDNFK